MIVEKIISIRKKDSNIEIESILQYDVKCNEVKFTNKLFGEQSFKGIDLLDAFNQLRSFIEKNGFLILVNGARINVWASGMLRDMSNGISTYVLEENGNQHIVNIFDPCVSDIVEFEEQKKFHNNWLREHKNRL